MKKILITGGLGFIGINLIFKLLKDKNNLIINIDKVSRYSNKNVKFDIKRYIFYKTNLLNKSKLNKILLEHRPDYIFHLAAESHVDRSIKNPNLFINNNINATMNILNGYKLLLDSGTKVLLHCISTDEIYGDLKIKQKSFTEKSPILPNSPYSASKASCDLLCRAYMRTYDIPIIVTNCSNNFGPYQYPEKLIPFNLNNALKEKDILVYGDGKNIRDWIYVEDHVNVLVKIMKNRKMKRSNYNIGGNYEITNYKLILKICDKLNKLKKNKNFKKILNENLDYKSLIKFVKDRPGHDFRYAVSNRLLQKEININKIINRKKFETKLNYTINWYIKENLIQKKLK